MKLVVHTKAGAQIEYADAVKELRYEIDQSWVHVMRVDVDPRYLLGRQSLVRIGSVARGEVLSIALVEETQA